MKGFITLTKNKAKEGNSNFINKENIILMILADFYHCGLIRYYLLKIINLLN